MRKVLIIEDDQSFSRLIKHSLENDINTEVDVADNYLKGLSMAINTDYDLYLVDLNLDGESGIDLIKILAKNKKIDNKVIVVSAVITKELQIEGYNLGVSNFVSKPVDLDLLKAIMRKNLRMLDNSHSEILSFYNLYLNLGERRAYAKVDEQKEELNLSPTEYTILFKLLNARGNVVSKEELSYSGKDENKAMSFKSVEMHISAIRKKLEINKVVYIESKWGVGYYLKYRQNKQVA